MDPTGFVIGILIGIAATIIVSAIGGGCYSIGGEIKNDTMNKTILEHEKKVNDIMNKTLEEHIKLHKNYRDVLSEYMK